MLNFTVNKQCRKWDQSKIQGFKSTWCSTWLNVCRFAYSVNKASVMWCEQDLNLNSKLSPETTILQACFQPSGQAHGQEMARIGHLLTCKHHQEWWQCWTHTRFNLVLIQAEFVRNLIQRRTMHYTERVELLTNSKVERAIMTELLVMVLLLLPLPPILLLLFSISV